jgi:hypothetical protein
MTVYMITDLQQLQKLYVEMVFPSHFPHAVPTQQMVLE